MAVVLLSASERRFATRAYSRATCALALRRRLEPFRLRLRFRWAFFNRLRFDLSACGLCITVPSDNVASSFTPKSMPTLPPFGGDGIGRSARSTVRLACQRPPRLDTLMRSTFAPSTRLDASSMQCTRPILGSFSAYGSWSMRPNEPVVYAKRRMPESLDLKRGNPILRPFRCPLRDLEKFFSASANDSRPLLYASLLFLGHHGSPVVSSMASVFLAWFHHLRRA